MFRGIQGGLKKKNRQNGKHIAGIGVRLDKQAHTDRPSDEFMTNDMRKDFCGIFKVVSEQRGSVVLT